MERSNFISKDNINNIYSFVNSKIGNVDLNADKNNKKIVKKLIKSVYERNPKSTFDDLNKIAVESIVPFMLNRVNKTTAKDTSKGNDLPGISNGNNLQGINDMLSNLDPLGQDNFAPIQPPTQTQSQHLTQSQNLDQGRNLNRQHLNQNIDLKLNLDDEKESRLSSNDMAALLSKKNQERNYDRFLNDSNKFREDVKKANEIQSERIEDINSRKLPNNFFDNLDKTNEPNDLSLAYEPPNDFYNLVSKELPNNSQNIVNDISIKLIDHSGGNEVSSYDPDISTTDIIKDSFSGGKNLPIPKLYENTQTGSERIMNSVLVIDSGTYNLNETDPNVPKESLNVMNGGEEVTRVRNLGNNPWYKFRVSLNNTLNIDKICDVYLKRFTLIGASPMPVSFVFRIDEIISRASSNNQEIKESYTVNNTVDKTLSTTGISITNNVAVSHMNTITVNPDPTNIILVGDELYVNGLSIGKVTATTNNSITIGSGTNISIAGGSTLFKLTTSGVLNTASGEDQYLTTINPKKISSLTVTLTDQDGNNTDSANPNNNTFLLANSGSNRVLIELEFRARNIDRTVDFVNGIKTE